ncbi:ABC-2 type transport system permease protein [Rhodococcus sp. PvR044]|uniref:ABC transporter permease n=1 Tax=Rhodococcus TaxID=1827 RepID=UPI00339AD6A5
MTTAVLTHSPARTDHRARWSVAAGQIFRRWSVNTMREAWGVGVSLLQPVIWILLFGQVFTSIGTIPGFGSDGYITFLVPGILMMTVLYSGAWAGTGYIEDIDNGVMDQLLTAPVRRSALVAGQLAQQLVVGLLQSAIVLVIGFAGGARYPGGVGGVGLALVAATLLAAAFCSLSTAVALTTRSHLALIGIAQMVVLPVTFLSTAMMPRDLMPGWVQAVSRYNPMTWSVEIARTGLAGTANWGEIAWQLGLLTALATAAFAWSIAAFNSYRRAL